LTIQRRPLFFAILVVALLFSPAYTAASTESASSLVERGDKFFQIRGVNHMGDWAVPGNIRNALDLYIEAYDMGEPSQELIEKILHASYFYANYAKTDKEKQKKAVDRALEIGTKGLKAYPDSAGINYWMASLWGRWSGLHGRIASARKDVALKVKAFAEKTIELDPSYCEGGGYRTLGRLHYKTPKIPFFLTWPNKKKALELLEKAVKEAPDNLTNRLFYAESLIERGKRDQARKEITFIQKAEIHEEKVVEELRVKGEAIDVMTRLNDNIKLNREERFR